LSLSAPLPEELLSDDVLQAVVVVSHYPFLVKRGNLVSLYSLLLVKLVVWPADLRDLPGNLVSLYSLSLVKLVVWPADLRDLRDLNFPFAASPML
jgi:hypothetical protein